MHVYGHDLPVYLRFHFRIFDRITTLQIDNACSHEMYIFNLEKALVFLLTYWHRFRTCLSNFSLLSISTPKSLLWIC